MTTPQIPAMQWWERRRLLYNLWLIAALIAGGFTTLLVMSFFEAIIATPVVDQKGNFLGYDNDMGGVAFLGPCCASVLGVGFANICYFLGALGEIVVSERYLDGYRRWAWRAGLLFSCLLPFAAALFHLVTCLFFPQSYDHSPLVIGAPSET